MALNIEKNISGKYRIRHPEMDISFVNPVWMFKQFDTIEEAEETINQFILSDKWEVVKSVDVY